MLTASIPTVAAALVIVGLARRGLMVWKRAEPVQPTGVREGTGTAAPAAPPPAPAVAPAAQIGKSVVIKGEVNGREDLTVEGSIEGTMELREHVLTIGPHGHIKAEIFAKVVIVEGAVTGTITASEKVDLRETGSVDGDLVAPRVAIADGAHFRGRVEMERTLRPPE
jgi:cytoskeletal protein CcmA (bactofilin family)